MRNLKSELIDKLLENLGSNDLKLNTILNRIVNFEDKYEKILDSIKNANIHLGDLIESINITIDLSNSNVENSEEIINSKYNDLHIFASRAQDQLNRTHEARDILSTQEVEDLIREILRNNLEIFLELKKAKVSANFNLDEK
jgi:hypothetical protein